MSLNLGQIFYGVGLGGYDVLGSTAMPDGIEAKAVRFCEQIGAPERVVVEKETVLATMPIGNSVLMACVQNGPLDKFGRKSAFFHLLVADAKALEESGIDVFDLYEADLFKSDVPSGALSNIECSDIRHSNSSLRPFQVHYPSVLMIDKPDNGLVRSLLGDQINKRTWVSYVDSVAAPFDFCAVDSHSYVPDRCFEYNSNGLVRPPIQRQESSTNNEKCCNAGRHENPSVGGGFALKVSVALNICLIILSLALLSFNRRGDEKTDDVRYRQSQPESNLVENEKLHGRLDKLVSERNILSNRLDSVLKLVNAFPDESRIIRIEDSALVKYINGRIKGWESENPTFVSDFRRMTFHIDFVNQLFETINKKEKEK